MKKIIAVLWVFSLLLPFPAFGETAETLTFIVATDLHYLAPELTDHGEYFQEMIAHSDGKVMAYSEELMEAFVGQVVSLHPDALILSGDLTFNGERISHEQLAQKLARIEAAGIPVLVLPGNHDLNSRSAVRYTGNGYEHVDSVTAEDFRTIYGPFGYAEALSQERGSLSYMAALTNTLRVLMVDVNDTNPQGEVSAQTLAWIDAQLEQAQQDGCRVIAVSHLNLLSHSRVISSGFTISNAGELYALYESRPVLCNLSGHIHMQHRCEIDGLWDIATSSLAVSPNQYGVLTLTENQLTYRAERVDVSAWAAAHGCSDKNLLDFAGYSDGFFRETSRQQAPLTVSKDENPEELADFFAALNATYFAGRLDEWTSDEAIAARWQQDPAFLSLYIWSILQESPQNHCELTIAY